MFERKINYGYTKPVYNIYETWLKKKNNKSTTDGGSHAGWSFQRRMVDHMQVGVIAVLLNDGNWRCR